jgi:hypothetical protein
MKAMKAKKWSVCHWRSICYVASLVTPIVSILDHLYLSTRLCSLNACTWMPSVVMAWIGAQKAPMSSVCELLCPTILRFAWFCVWCESLVALLELPIASKRCDRSEGSSLMWYFILGRDGIEVWNLRNYFYDVSSPLIVLTPPHIKSDIL